MNWFFLIVLNSLYVKWWGPFYMELETITFIENWHLYQWALQQSITPGMIQYSFRFFTTLQITNIPRSTVHTEGVQQSQVYRHAASTLIPWAYLNVLNLLPVVPEASS